MTLLTERERLLHLMSEYNMNAKQFAAEVEIQPGTISNIMKGRNNPSLDVMQRVLKRFPQLSPEWLIMGTGSMQRNLSNSQQTLFNDVAPLDVKPSDTMPQPVDTLSMETATPSIAADKATGMDVFTAIQTMAKPDVQPRKVKKITIFFDDGTFQELD